MDIERIIDKFRKDTSEKIVSEDGTPIKKKGSKKFKIGAGILTAGALFTLASIDYIKPYEQGIKQVSISPFGLLGDKGVQTEVYKTGYHIVLPFFEKMLKVPTDVQNLTMRKSEEIDTETRFIKPAKIQTKDGFYVDLDATVLYRITDPHKLITSVGAGTLYQDNGIIPKTEPALRATLGSMNPEEFYNAELRIQGSNEAKIELDSVVRDKGMEVDDLLIRKVTYHPKIQDKIESRVVQQQLVYTNIAKSAEADVQAKLTERTQQGLAAVDVKLQEGTSYKTEIGGQIDFYTRSKAAEGNEAIRLANAYSTQVINNAYDAEGSELLVGRELAKLYTGIERVLVPMGGKGAFNPLEVKTFQGQYTGGGLK